MLLQKNFIELSRNLRTTCKIPRRHHARIFRCKYKFHLAYLPHVRNASFIAAGSEKKRRSNIFDRIVCKRDKTALGQHGRTTVISGHNSVSRLPRSTKARKKEDLRADVSVLTFRSPRGSRDSQRISSRASQPLEGGVFRAREDRGRREDSRGPPRSWNPGHASLAGNSSSIPCGHLLTLLGKTTLVASGQRYHPSAWSNAPQHPSKVSLSLSLSLFVSLCLSFLRAFFSFIEQRVWDSSSMVG